MAVARRRVLYIPGYDPIPPRRYRELYRREGAEQARIGGYALTMGARRDRGGFGWGVAGVFPVAGTDGTAPDAGDGLSHGTEIPSPFARDGHRTEGLPPPANDPRQGDAAPPDPQAPAPTAAGTRPSLGTEAEFEVLVWSDVVAASMGRSILATYGQLLRTAWIYIASGALAAMMRLRRGPVLAALYPVAALAGQALLALAAAIVFGWAVARPLPWWVAVPMAAGLFVAALIGFKRLDGRLFAYYLMHDYAFTARLRGAYPPELGARIDRFADRIAEVLRGDWDEVLVVGHSSGAYLAVSVLAELARRQPPDPRLALLTLGHVVPMAAFLPDARRLRGDLAAVSASPTPWVDVTAPGDACSFGLCDPVATCGAEPEARNGPLVLSAAFTQTLSPARLRALRHRWFRLHFQYLCAFDHPEGYDYFAITAGPLTLAERFAGRHHSPGRITRAVAPFQDRAP